METGDHRRDAGGELNPWSKWRRHGRGHSGLDQRKLTHRHRRVDIEVRRIDQIDNRVEVGNHLAVADRWLRDDPRFRLDHRNYYTVIVAPDRRPQPRTI